MIAALVTAGCSSKSSISSAESKLSIVGQDYLALQKRGFKAKAAIKALKGREDSLTAIGMLDLTFGRKLKKVKRILQEVRPVYLRVHLWNTTCNRNGVCQKDEPTYGYSLSGLEQAILNKNKKLLARLTKRTKVYMNLSAGFPETEFLVSPALEHNLSKAAWRVLADTVKKAWPGVQLVNSPMSNESVERYKGAWIERHGQYNYIKDAEIFSFDGREGSDVDISEFLKQTKSTRIAFFWSRVYNCRDNSDSFTPPKERTACPSPALFEEFAHITDQHPAPPVFQGGQALEFKPPYIWKPLAEDHGNGDPRSNFPLAIVKPEGGSLSILTFDNKKIGQLDLYGPFENGLDRYYMGWGNGSDLNGYEVEKKARKLSGHPWVWLKGKQRTYGPILPGRRAGVYR